MAALAVTGTSLAASAAEIVVATYGGVTGDTLDACLFKKFTEETGIGIVPEPGVSIVTLNKLVQQKDDPAISVAFMDAGVSEMADAAGVVAPLDPAKIPNLANIIPQGLYKNAKGEIFALSGGYTALGLIYNKDEVKEPPTSWSDLWKPEYENVVTAPSPTNAIGIPWLMTIGSTFGSGADDAETTFAKLKALKPALYFDTAGAADNAFQAGEVIIGAHYSFSASTLSDQGLNIGYAKPKEGPIASDIRIHLVRNGPNPEMAEKLVDFLARSSTYECLAEKIYYGPAVANAKLSEKASERMPWGKGGSVEDIVFIDRNVVNEKRQALTDMWNREIGKK
jgi:putative spermidine/putrescine transport system substrate-binding protein